MLFKEACLFVLARDQHDRDETVGLHIAGQPFELCSIIPARLDAETIWVRMPFTDILEHSTGLLLDRMDGV
ncbi:MAG: hypothetical protein ABSG41_04340 [Bryobacteraceae bacterium]